MRLRRRSAREVLLNFSTNCTAGVPNFPVLERNAVHFPRVEPGNSDVVLQASPGGFCKGTFIFIFSTT